MRSEAMPAGAAATREPGSVAICFRKRQIFDRCHKVVPVVGHGVARPRRAAVGGCGMSKGVCSEFETRDRAKWRPCLPILEAFCARRPC